MNSRDLRLLLDPIKSRKQVVVALQLAPLAQVNREFPLKKGLDAILGTTFF